MSLKPRNVDFQETWANLKETVAGVVSLRAVERAVWNNRFSDVYALCVAHPEPLADRLLQETRLFLEEHVAGLLKTICADAALESDDYDDGLLERYVASWREFSEGAAYLNCLYSYLNLQHVKRQKVSEAEVLYGGGGDERQLEVGALALNVWERGAIAPLAAALTARLVRALDAARDDALEARMAAIVRDGVWSTVRVRAHCPRAPLALYARLVEGPYVASAGALHARRAAALLQALSVPEYMQRASEMLSREERVARQFLHPSSAEAARAACERAAVGAHLPALHAECGALLRAALDAPAAERAARRAPLRTLHRLLAPLGPAALRPLVDAAHAHAAADGHAAASTSHRDDAHVQFVVSMLSLHNKYSDLFADVFSAAQQPFQGALDKACSEVVNARPSPDAPARAPELLARYCDTLLRKKGNGEGDTEEKLAAAITVFKYVDDKDVFQKYYARALARRLIHQLSASMEHEEAMINRLKAACGYEFTNKLHRMFTDVHVSRDLNDKFAAHLRATGAALDTAFQVQVLQAGAWPLGGGAGGALPPGAERAARLFDAFYRRAFSGRRLAWLPALCAADVRVRFAARPAQLAATAPQAAALLCFERCDALPAAEVAERALGGAADKDAWARHVRPLLEARLLLHAPAPAAPDDLADGTLSLNLAFSSKRTRIRLTAAATAAAHHSGGGAGGAGGGHEAASCDDDRKMYLQAAIVRIMKQRKVLRHTELIQEVVSQARASFAPSVAMIKKCIEALIDKQYLERTPNALDSYSYLA